MHSMILRFAVVTLVLAAVPRVALAVEKCSSFVSWRPADGCPTADNHCLAIDLRPGEDPAEQIGILLPRCDWKNVQFEVTRSNTIMNCDSQTIDGHETEGPSSGIHLRSLGSIETLRAPACGDGVGEQCRATPGLTNVTLMNCKVRGYTAGIEVSVSFRDIRDAMELYEATYVDWFDHPNERICRASEIARCALATAPQNITISGVTTEDQTDVGIYVYSWVHHLTIVGSTIRRSGHGPGLYLDAGSRENEILGNIIIDNQREGIALDGSAANTIRGNTIKHNGLRSQPSRVGIAIFKNFWEGRWESGRYYPRAFGSDENIIEDNHIIDHAIGIDVGRRQDWSDPYAPGDPLAGAGDPIYYRYGGENFFRERARGNHILLNTFVDNAQGIMVRDDDTEIRGNTFEGSRPNDIVVGNLTRQRAAEPVRGTRILDNTFSSVLPPFRAVRHAYCALDTEYSGNSEPELVREACGFTRSFLAALGGSASGHTMIFNRKGATFTAAQTWRVGDVDADGLDDVVNLEFAGDGRLHMWLHLTGSRFAYQSGLQIFEWPTSLAKNGQWLVGQFDATPGQDLLYVYGSGTTACVQVWSAVGDGFQRVTSDACMPVSSTYAADQRWLATDFTGDGLDDLLQVHANSGITQVQAHPRGNFAFSWFRVAPTFTLPYSAWRAEDQFLAADFDGDGLGDVARIYRNTDDKARIRVSYLNASGVLGTRTQDFAKTATPGDSASFPAVRRWVASNFDGQPGADLVLVYPNASDARVWKHRAVGRSFVFAGIQTVETYDESQRWLSGHFDADASEDLLRVSGRAW